MTIDGAITALRSLPPRRPAANAATPPPYDYDQVTIDGAIRGIREGGHLRRQREAAARKSAKPASPLT